MLQLQAVTSLNPLAAAVACLAPPTQKLPEVVWAWGGAH